MTMRQRNFGGQSDTGKIFGKLIFMNIFKQANIFSIYMQILLMGLQIVIGSMCAVHLGGSFLTTFCIVLYRVLPGSHRQL